MNSYANRKLGPNVRRLLFGFIAREAIPEGGDIRNGLDFLRDKDRISQTMRVCAEKMFESLDAVKVAPDNTFGNDDEAIAGEILRQIEVRKQNNGK